MSIVGFMQLMWLLGELDMRLDTVRFGPLSCTPHNFLLFPGGLIGFEGLTSWLLLDERPLSWLQSVEDPSVALPLASPFHFVPEYCFRLSTDDCQSLHAQGGSRLLVLAVVVRDGGQWTMNLRAPVLINQAAAMGRQLVTIEEQPLRHALPCTVGALRKCA
jgi:flagellar assembly factor FliW